MRTDRSNNPIANKAYPVVLSQLDKLGYKKGQDYDIGDSTAGIDTDATPTIKYANPTVGFKASQEILKQGQISSWYANSAKYGGAATTTIPTLAKLSGKQVDPSNAQDVYNSLDPVKQKEVVKAIYKHEGGSGILSTFESFDEKVNSSRKKGYSDTQILDNLGKISPDLKDKIDKTRALFGKDPMINNDGDILARLSQKYAGKVPTAPQGQGIVPPDQKKQDIAQKGGLTFIPGTGVVQPKPDNLIQGANKKIEQIAGTPAGKTVTGAVGGFFQDIFNKGKKMVEGIGRNVSEAGELLKAGQPHAALERVAVEAPLQVTGAAGGLVGDAFGKIISTSAPILGKIASKIAEVSPQLQAGKAIISTALNSLPKEQHKQLDQQLTSLNNKGKEGLSLLISEGGKKYEDWKAKNPEMADTAENVANSLNLLGIEELAPGIKTMLERKAITEVATGLTEKETANVAEKFTKAVRPGDVSIRNAGGLEAYRKKATEAMSDIVAHLPKMNIIDKETGEAVTQISKMKNAVDGTLQAVDEGKKLIFKAYDNLQRSAGESAKIDLNPIADQMESFAKDNKVLQTEYPQVYKQMLADAQALRDAGSYTLEEAQESIRKANDSLQSFYRTGAGGDAAQARAFVASRLRTMIDEEVEGATGQSYQALKNKYGNFKTIEKDVMRMATRSAKKAPKGLFDVLGDMAASGEMMRGLITMNPGDIAASAGIKLTSAWYKALNSPNNLLRKAFRIIEESAPEGKAIEEGLQARPKPLLQLPAPKEGAPNVSINTPINLPEKAVSTQEAEQTSKLSAAQKFREGMKPSEQKLLPAGRGNFGAAIPLPAKTISTQESEQIGKFGGKTLVEPYGKGVLPLGNPRTVNPDAIKLTADFNPADTFHPGTLKAEYEVSVIDGLKEATAGRRDIIGSGIDRQVISTKSTFPKWIPEKYRLSSVIKPVYEHIMAGTIPTQKAQKELYDIIKNEFDTFGKEVVEAKKEINPDEIDWFSPKEQAQLDEVNKQLKEYDNQESGTTPKSEEVSTGENEKGATVKGSEEKAVKELAPQPAKVVEDVKKAGVEVLPKDASVYDESKKVGAKRIAPDKVPHQQLTPEEGIKKLVDKQKETMSSRANNWQNAAEKIDAIIAKYGNSLPSRTSANIKKYPDLMKDYSTYSHFKKYSISSNLEGMKKYFSERAASLKVEFTPEQEARALESAKKDYVSLVKSDISKGYKYPEAVLNYDKSFKTAVDSRARYEKGLFTSFSADDSRIVFDDKNRISAGMKRQDGKELLPEQKQEIIDGVLQTQKALGVDLNKLSEDERWVYAHLNGKNPFLTNNAAGLYRKSDGYVSISLGGTEGFDAIVDGEKVRQKVNTTVAHEIGHALDSNAKDNLLNFDDYYELRKSYKPTVSYGRGPKYWGSKREVTARAIEEYVAINEGHTKYFDNEGYWNKETYESIIKPAIEKGIDKNFSEYKVK